MRVLRVQPEGEFGRVDDLRGPLAEINMLRFLHTELNDRWIRLWSLGEPVQRISDIAQVRETAFHAADALVQRTRETHLALRGGWGLLELRATAVGFLDATWTVHQWERQFFCASLRDARVILEALVLVANRSSWHAARAHELREELTKVPLQPEIEPCIRAVARAADFIKLHLPGVFSGGTVMNMVVTAEEADETGKAPPVNGSDKTSAFSVDTQRRQVFYGAAPLRINQGAHYRVLAALIHAQGQHVSFDQLLRAAKPGATHARVVSRRAPKELVDAASFIRRELRRAGASNVDLRIERGIGYYLAQT